jgi:hypothetical protein
MTKINPQDFVDASVFQIKFCDSDNWSVAVPLTQKRLDNIYKDLSIDKIKLTTKDGVIYELDVL